MSTDQRSTVLAGESRSVTVARHFVRDVLSDWQLEELTDDAQLCTSELLGNAVQHSSGEVVLTISRDDRVVIDVHDQSPDLQYRSPAEPVPATATSGRGLLIVHALSAEWGVRHGEDGKSVWFALALPDAGGREADVLELDDHRQVVHPKFNPAARPAVDGARARAAR